MSESEIIDRLLHGAVDLHVHPFPSPFPRRIDILEAARHMAEAGFRAIVVKSHHHSTATDVAALRPNGLDATGVEVFGAVALNSQVGGLNPAAVNICLALGGKMVWFPTISSPAHLHHEKGDLKFPTLAIPLMPETPNDIWDERGDIKAEVFQILDLVKEAGAVLSAGHMPPRSVIALLEAARAKGIDQLVVNHPNFVIEASDDEVRQMIELGAYIEHSLCMFDEESTFHQWPVSELVKWIRWVGPERTLLGSDLGQKDNPLPVESYRKTIARLLDAGIDEKEVRLMVASNGAHLLRLDA